MSENSTDPEFDAAADLDTLSLGMAPSQSMAILDAVMAQTVGMAMYNAVGAQQNASNVRGAAVTMACAAMLSLPVAETDKPARGMASALTGAAKAALDTATAKVQADNSSPTSGSSASEQADTRTVDPAITDAIDQTETAVLSQDVVLTGGAGKAFQLVALSAALAVQDAAAALGGMSTLAATASAMAFTRFLTTGDPKYLAGVTAAADVVRLATDDFARISAAASTALKEFPSG